MAYRGSNMMATIYNNLYYQAVNWKQKIPLNETEGATVAMERGRCRETRPQSVPPGHNLSRVTLPHLTTRTVPHTLRYDSLAFDLNL